MAESKLRIRVVVELVDDGGDIKYRYADCLEDAEGVIQFDDLDDATETIRGLIKQIKPLILKDRRRNYEEHENKKTAPDIR